MGFPRRDRRTDAAAARGLDHGMALGWFGCHQDRTAAWNRRIQACPTGASAAKPVRVRRDAGPQRCLGLACPPAPEHRIRAFAWRRNTPKRPRRAMRFATPPPREHTSSDRDSAHAGACARALDPLRGGAQPADPPAQLRERRAAQKSDRAGIETELNSQRANAEWTGRRSGTWKTQ